MNASHILSHKIKNKTQKYIQSYFRFQEKKYTYMQLKKRSYYFFNEFITALNIIMMITIIQASNPFDKTFILLLPP